MAVPGADVFALDVALAGSLAGTLPLARRWAGIRLGESGPVLRRAGNRTAVGALVWLSWTGAIASSGVLLR
jgi:hypothetical protein